MLPKEIKVLGSYPITVNKNDYKITMAQVPVKLIKLDVNNPRLSGTGFENMSDTKSSQDKISNYLLGDTDDKKMKNAADALRKAIEFNGGLAEPLIGQAWKKFIKTLEGNRRAADAISKMNPDDYVVMGIVPDDMPQHDIDTYINMKHTVGHAEWSSYVRSKRAYELWKTYEQSIDDITIQCQFASKKETEKYIGAFIWFTEYVRLTGLAVEKCSKDWSKFHHAYTPTLRSHFGFDFETEKFDPLKRGSGKKDPALCVESIDEEVKKINETIPKDQRIADFEKSDFGWFCNLVANGNLSDCRHSDNLVVPIVNNAYENDPKVWDIFKILMTKRTKTSESPSTLAQRKLAERRASKNVIAKMAESLVDEIKDTIKNGAKWKAFKSSEDFEETVLQLKLLKIHLPDIIGRGDDELSELTA